jgi:histone-lysine N-methyltransferase SETMAR
MISTPKVMVSIFWSPLGFPVITARQSRIKFMTAYLCRDLIPKIVEGMPPDLENSPREFMLHMDNARPHPAQWSITHLNTFRVHPIDHPPYSSDLAPSGFYLFGKLNGVLTGQKFESTEELLLAIRSY